MITYSLLPEGVSIVTSFVRFKISIKGVFDSQTDKFDRSRHQLHVNASA